ncbi:hypothetical protein HK413_02460 [Mucilaginibacter sp. S1162]|uniref:BAAT/Acyl-CoA thioester hydrolase C-terminal domain-containing protein n=1 Tax=Mucilaginibacter humi TaxID=2732510 RepID=A0ABX1VZD0_9SPHI|nr:acyl-CoA thioester hydrolase/BAAT C-terminal domain-containing protein [Mucilaginibacter humi]NNU33311.1 hypothetical protein [Mucilaginibacter humi]
MFYLRAGLLLSFIISLTTLKAQPVKPADHGLKEFTLKDVKLGVIRFYVDTVNIKKKKPFFIEINGSGGLPLCIFIKGKGFGSIYNTSNEQLRAATQKDFHYIILGKPGTLFCDTIKTNDDATHFDAHRLIANYKFSAEYTKQLSLNWRVAATKKVITYLINKGYWDGTKIAAYGYSEGGQVVPSLAVADKRITHVIDVVGSGLNQFYDGIMAWRVKAAKGEITQQQAQDSIAIELKRIKDIYANPNNTRLEYLGHSYKRWASFGLNPPFEKLRMLNIPIYMIVATADESSPIYGLDYVQLDFIRLGKKNLTYEPCVGCDHYLNNPDADKSKAHTDYNAKVLKWLSR